VLISCFPSKYFKDDIWFGHQMNIFFKTSKIKSVLSGHAEMVSKFTGIPFKEQKKKKKVSDSSLKTLNNSKCCSGNRINIFSHIFFSAIGRFCVCFSPIGRLSPVYYIHGRLSEQFSGSKAAFRRTCPRPLLVSSEEGHRKDFHN
jgi:hypothetical protein